MDTRAFGEALLAVAMTPVISVGMALAVVAGILMILRKADRR
jgi:hypothetical protein